jgi:very-short-patch-repair endonuclease
MNKFDVFREAYKYALPKIMKYAPKGVDPYFLNWMSYFTPIEEQAWLSIRYHGLPFYPQLPILRYYLDFGNPYYKIGIELDGKDYHDIERDKIRDQNLNDAGWRIFRITGSEMMRSFKTQCELEELGASENEREDGARNWIMNTGDGVIAAIGKLYYKKYTIPDNYLYHIYCTLNKHKIIDFEIEDVVDDDEGFYY